MTQGDSKSDVRTIFPSEDPTVLPLWLEHVAVTNQNPAVIVDATFGFKPLYAHGPFDQKRAMGIYLDGHTETRIRDGSPKTFGFWEP